MTFKTQKEIEKEIRDETKKLLIYRKLCSGFSVTDAILLEILFELKNRSRK